MRVLSADAVEIARELESEVEPENVAEWCHLMINPEQTRSCILYMSKESDRIYLT